MTAGKSPLATVIGQGGKCIGFLMKRRPGEVEGFGADEKSIGTFTDEAAAVAAVQLRHVTQLNKVGTRP